MNVQPDTAQRLLCVRLEYAGSPHQFRRLAAHLDHNATRFAHTTLPTHPWGINTQHGQRSIGRPLLPLQECCRSGDHHELRRYWLFLRMGCLLHLFALPFPLPFPTQAPALRIARLRTAGPCCTPSTINIHCPRSWRECTRSDASQGFTRLSRYPPSL
ncbi:hypothetical protein CC86DRAFT_107796 [Ophiobolus disseminans]|uniref:Uncharacterized protein n=1 Tax=Ophiobolus disseminans TaxID=1469910 RepID=A0A6A6ZL22_9PLEO|nr:hypothetical protein CC86DRAFT_107796 [Ophiobolus disseminans]